MDRLPLKMNLPWPGTKNSRSFGDVRSFQLHEDTGGERLWAVALSDRAQPQVFDYPVNEEGMQALANLIRSEEVLAVIRGKRADFEIASVVEVSIGGHKMQDRLPMPRGF